jgi:hypothetical protein
MRPSPDESEGVGGRRQRIDRDNVVPLRRDDSARSSCERIMTAAGASVIRPSSDESVMVVGRRQRIDRGKVVPLRDESARARSRAL